METFLTGYCRQTDQSRMVEVIIERGTLEEVDCCYGNCTFQSQCTIGKGIAELLKQ